MERAARQRQVNVDTSEVHPGELLRAELAERGMTQLALATAMGRLPQVVNSIVTGKKPVTADTALDLEQALGIEPMYWLNAQAAHDLWKARQRRAARGTPGTAAARVTPYA